TGCDCPDRPARRRRPAVSASVRRSYLWLPPVVIVIGLAETEFPVEVQRRQIVVAHLEPGAARAADPRPAERGGKDLGSHAPPPRTGIHRKAEYAGKIIVLDAQRDARRPAIRRLDHEHSR